MGLGTLEYQLRRARMQVAIGFELPALHSKKQLIVAHPDSI
jgi:hypothetical protein